jgi:hypothetical protein
MSLEAFFSEAGCQAAGDVGHGAEDFGKNLLASSVALRQYLTVWLSVHRDR